MKIYIKRKILFEYNWIFFIYLKKGNKYFCLKNYHRNWDLKEKKKFFLIEWWLIRMRYFFLLLIQAF